MLVCFRDWMRFWVFVIVVCLCERVLVMFVGFVVCSVLFGVLFVAFTILFVLFDLDGVGWCWMVLDGVGVVGVVCVCCVFLGMKKFFGFGWGYC